eukprot:Pgem_evm1s9863
MNQQHDDTILSFDCLVKNELFRIDRNENRTLVYVKEKEHEINTACTAVEIEKQNCLQQGPPKQMKYDSVSNLCHDLGLECENITNGYQYMRFNLQNEDLYEGECVNITQAQLDCNNATFQYNVDTFECNSFEKPVVKIGVIVGSAIGSVCIVVTLIVVSLTYYILKKRKTKDLLYGLTPAEFVNEGTVEIFSDVEYQSTTHSGFCSSVNQSLADLN